METIDRIESIIANAENTTFEKEGINPTFYWAYRNTRRTENSLLNFDDVIWERDIPQIVKNLRECGVKEFTISSGFSNLIDRLAEFAAQGCMMIGTTTVKANYTDFSTGKPAILNAIRMKIN